MLIPPRLNSPVYLLDGESSTMCKQEQSKRNNISLIPDVGF